MWYIRSVPRLTLWSLCLCLLCITHRLKSSQSIPGINSICNNTSSLSTSRMKWMCFDTSDWTISCYLKLNQDKIEYTVIWSQLKRSKLQYHFPYKTLTNTVHNLCLVMKTNLSFPVHTQSIFTFASLWPKLKNITIVV